MSFYFGGALDLLEITVCEGGLSRSDYFRGVGRLCQCSGGGPARCLETCFWRAPPTFGRGRFVPLQV